MLKMTDRLRPNEAEVAAKVMDGEAIMINLSNGMYYSMDQVGGLIWAMIDAGHRLDQIAATIAEQYEVEPSVARADLERLANELLEEKLVLVADGEAALGPFEPGQPGATDGSKLAYMPPVLNAYRDLGALLALDPPMPGLKDVPWAGAPAEAGRQ